MSNTNIYDVVVIGGGHAGCEAALASARLGAETLLITMNMDHIAQMSCNPAIGGIAKGHVVREIDALGGAMGRVTDAASIQFRMLNHTKGPAVWSPRSQCDKQCYQKAMKRELEIQPNLMVHQAEGLEFEVKEDQITGVTTQFGDIFKAKSFILTSGTFLSGKLHYGTANFAGGRAGDPASEKMSECLAEKLKLRIGRLKTGTPARILAKSIDFTKMTVQDADDPEERFSFYDEISSPAAIKKNMPCYLVKSTPETVKIVKENIHRSPLYAGEISGIGTRYCPSFEDKVVKFPHHETHQLYLEPEGEFTEEYYINGISTSLPVDVQIKMLQSIPGLENVRISRYAYAIEYDFVFPDQIERSLRVKKWKNLFLAGQINGTSGYEEAAGQGLIAGLNAARSAAGQEMIELGRDTSYIGVMIDDLVTKEIIEPYRLFTSRAEYRLRLRQDNADLRLSPLAYDLGLLSEDKYAKFADYRKKVRITQEKLEKEKIEGKTLAKLLLKMKGKPDFANLPFPAELIDLDAANKLDRKILKHIVINAHYKGYIEREEIAVKKLNKLEEWKIPADFNYDSIKGLKNESRLKLKNVTPTTLSQASRIDGVTPPEITLLQVHLKRGQSQMPV
jgi:tRNA uridine 5-carboxymethylaminomethyl modification enzyme